MSRIPFSLKIAFIAKAFDLELNWKQTRYSRPLTSISNLLLRIEYHRNIRYIIQVTFV